MRKLNLGFALLVASLCVWQARTVPDYASHQFECGGDYECFEEELRVFGTWNGSNPYWFTDAQKAERCEHLETPEADWCNSVKLDYRGTID
jgi:hypothetical protein